MTLTVKLIPVKPGSSDPVGEPEMIPCPDDVEPANVLSFLTQQFGALADRHRMDDDGDAPAGRRGMDL